jgi:cytochrome c553
MRQLLLIFLCLTASVCTAQDAPPGATTCSGCHGAGSSLPLDALTVEDIVTAMAAFRDGTRAATLMPRLAAGFTDAEIAAIATWIAAQGDGQ